jgi:hypothetical protein
MLYRECLRRGDPLLTIGGSDDARRLIPQVKWFRPLPELRLYARPVRPSQQAAVLSRATWRTPARFLRNLRCRILAPLPAVDGWSCQPVTHFDSAWTPRGPFTPLRREPGWLNYLLQCPAAAMTAASSPAMACPLGTRS